MSLLEHAGLYIHIPFCVSKCNYCDFNSYPGRTELIDDYFASIKKEIELYKPELKYYLFDTVFIGGGTPSYVDEKHIYNLMDLIASNLNISRNPEISIESNPGTLTDEKLKLYKKCGINRISIGLQAFQDRLLQYLGRKHNTKEFVSSIEMAKKAGFENINADVIFGIPGQTMSDWEQTLKALAEMELTHISAYSLKIEEGTRFGDMLNSNKLIPMDDELDREMYHYAIDFLELNGFHQYEISNFAKEGFLCRHNLTYWKCIDYLGLGAGAHSYLDNTRFSNVCSIEEYIGYLQKKEKPIDERCSVDFWDRMSEFMFLGLRLNRGVNNNEFKNLFDQDMFNKYSKVFDKLIKKKLIKIEGDSVSLTRLGLDLANQVFIEFV